jgi:signal transduction histidine kinase
MGVRLRTTLTATAAVAAALCLAAVALFAALSASLADSTKELALQDAKARAAAEGFTSKGAPGLAPPPAVPGGAGTVTVEDPGPGAGVGTIPAPPPQTGGAGGGAGTDTVADAVKHKEFVTAKGGGTLEITAIYPTKNGPVAVKGRASLTPARQAMTTLTHLLIPGVPAVVALVALFTWLAVGRALRPVSAIRAKVAEITAHGLHERVPEPRTRDEIAALARTVNATLDRLRTAVDAHRQFVADAAHELRSPMAILRTRLELARPAEKALAEAALDDVGRLQSLTSDLLLLARLDARQPLRDDLLDLSQLVAEEAARKRPRLEIRVALALTPDVLVNGSADHLRRLVANLVDNAVRHATTTVHVRLTRPDPHTAVLDVTDDGDGIPAEHRATVFDRFTRLDAARPRDTGGSGLGLPIARDIAAAHAATLTALPTPHGTGAHLRTVFPLAGAPPREKAARHAVLEPVS